MIAELELVEEDGLETAHGAMEWMGRGGSGVGDGNGGEWCGG